MPLNDTLAPGDPALPAASGLPESGPVDIRRVEVHVYRAPVDIPVLTSFGEMRDRPAVLVRVEDRDGAHGWGEVWCNFPACGAEHRARLVESVLAPRLLGTRFESVPEAIRSLEADTRVLAVQTAEWGPLAQALAGLDIALWDLAARRAKRALAALMAASAPLPSVPAYASGINPGEADRVIERTRIEGFRAFKIKVGFGQAADMAALGAARDMLSPREQLMVDANQAWGVDEAVAMSRVLADFSPRWLEEPLAADRPIGEWQRLHAQSPIPLAGGENLRGAQVFERAIAAGILTVIQPDMCKWGGFTGCLPVARTILAAGRRYCPHFLGAGIGLVASAHLLAAAGGDGLLEVDANPNPLRESLAAPFPTLDAGGRFPLPEGPGLGVTPDLQSAARWQVMHLERYGE